MPFGKNINICGEQYHPPLISLGDANSSARAFGKENELAVGRRDLHQPDSFAEPDKSEAAFSDWYGSTSVDRKNIRTDWEVQKPKVHSYTPISVIMLSPRM